MTIQFADLARAVAADHRVSDGEILELRRLGWGDGQIHRHEAEALFAVNRQLDEASSTWADFFVEAVGEFVLNGTEPRGYVSEVEADWLVGAIDHDGRLESMAELELLVRVLERARNVPDRLKHYALRQVENAVLTGTGPTRCGGHLCDTHVSAAECAILRRMIFASGGHGPAIVSRYDAEMLFRLKDATLAEANDPAWDALFVDGVANYLKAFELTRAQLDHGRMKELEAFIADNGVRVGRFMGAMARELPQVKNHFGKVFGKNASGTRYVEAQAAGNIVTDDENAWLERMMDADGQIDDLERALLARIASGD